MDSVLLNQDEQPPNDKVVNATHVMRRATERNCMVTADSFGGRPQVAMIGEF
jgi:hypothetical protein